MVEAKESYRESATDGRDFTPCNPEEWERIFGSWLTLPSLP